MKSKKNFDLSKLYDTSLVNISADSSAIKTEN